jgi:hypothetical protein
VTGGRTGAVLAGSGRWTCAGTRWGAAGATCATAVPNGSDTAAVNASNELMRTLIPDLNPFILKESLRPFTSIHRDRATRQ